MNGKYKVKIIIENIETEEEIISKEEKIEYTFLDFCDKINGNLEKYDYEYYKKCDFCEKFNHIDKMSLIGNSEDEDSVCQECSEKAMKGEL